MSSYEKKYKKLWAPGGNYSSILPEFYQIWQTNGLNGLLFLILCAEALPIYRRDAERSVQSLLDSEDSTPQVNTHKVTSIVTYSKGGRIACACGEGTVHLFERGTDTKNFFKKTKEIKVKELVQLHFY